MELIQSMHPIALKSWSNHKSCDLTLLVPDLSETSLETIRLHQASKGESSMIVFGNIQKDLYYI